MKGMLRPEAQVLPETSMVPAEKQVSPPPNQFTHELMRTQPFRFAGSPPETPPAGELSAGTRVVLWAHDGGRACHVVDERGLCVETEFEGLRKL